MLQSLLTFAALIAALLAGLEAGRRLGRRLDLSKDEIGTGAAEGVIFAVFGLIVAFTFSQAASRFNERRRLIVDQANALGTANLRLDALDPADRAAIRRKMLEWAQLAQTLSASAGDSAARDATLAQGAKLQGEIWSLAAAAVEKKQQPALWAFVMPPINDWTDLTSVREALNYLGTPPVVMPTVIGMSLVASILAGFQMSRYPRQSTLHRAVFAASLAFIITVMLDLNRPRSGLIRIGAADRSMAQTEASIRALLEP